MILIMFLLYFLTGIVAGILGGMGMGGGTLLIPMLSIFFGTNQHVAQAINLISFIPMAVVALVIHFKNKLVDVKGVLYTIVPGAVACIVSCFIAKSMGNDLLKRLFGAFLLILSAVCFFNFFKQKHE